MIRVDELRKEYGRVVAVDSVSFSVEAGEFVALIGHNGAGKSTTIKVLTGQLSPTAGAVSVADVDVLKLDLRQSLELLHPLAHAIPDAAAARLKPPHR